MEIIFIKNFIIYKILTVRKLRGDARPPVIPTKVINTDRDISNFSGIASLKSEQNLETQLKLVLNFTFERS